MQALARTGFAMKEVVSISPHELSGGQKASSFPSKTLPALTLNPTPTMLSWQYYTCALLCCVYYAEPAMDMTILFYIYRLSVSVYSVRWLYLEYGGADYE